MTLASIPRAISDIRAGRMIIVVDDEDRENEGDLCMAAEQVTPEAINFMAKYGRGLICLSLTEERIKQLDLPMMVENNTAKLETAFTVSIEASTGVTTGISAADRARTVQAAVADDATSADLVRPGHIFPLRAKPGGVLVRTGHTEAVVDLARLASQRPFGVICEIMNDDGTMARLPDLEVFAEKHGLLIISIADLIEYRATHESLVHCLIAREVEHADWGMVTVAAYGTSLDHRQHVVVIKGDLTAEKAPLVRVHSGYPLANVLGDLFSSDRSKLDATLRQLGGEERAVLLCLDQGQPNVPLAQRIAQLRQPKVAVAPQTIQRNIGIGAQILRDIGLEHLRLLTNNTRQLKGLEGYGLQIDEIVPLELSNPKSPRLEVVST